ncbi:MAG TPA: IclR family transcriptional regulator [Candidatus Sulfotelmatobacter sp.]|nr:IclR family transcriptional regulator [Candidatus Sulfotelmatobacter sp.]
MTLKGLNVMKKQGSRVRRVQADKNYIEVMGKIFAVLEYFIETGTARKSIASADLARALPFARTTVHRILYSLEKLGYVERDEVKSRYQLSPKFFELTGPAVHFRRLQTVSKGVMQSLLLRFGETVNLGMLEDGQVAYIDVLQSPSALRIAAMPGERNPVHCTALGKAMLAFLLPSEVESILEHHPLVRRTAKTITQKRQLLEHLASVREYAVALDMEENLNGVICAASPVFDQSGRVIAGISVSGPSSRMEQKLAQVQKEIRNSAMALSRMLSPGAPASEVLSSFRRSTQGAAGTAR